MDIQNFPTFRRHLEKRAFLEASTSGKQASRKMMHKMLELLLAQYLLYYELHWKYRAHYGDHLVFERLYDGVQKELDTLAEKIIGYHGSDQLELLELVSGANELIRQWTAGSEDFIGQALTAEKALQGMFHEYYDLMKAKDILPMGLDDFIMAACNDHETHTYLLQQLKSGRGGEKVAKVLSAKGRKQIDEGNFALPGRRYPIHDESHARNALARVAQHGTPAEQAAVRKAVAAKYPGIEQEKIAMPSKTNILKALGFTGLGAAAGGVGGYAAGHRTGMMRDAETPFGSQHMTMAYRKGQHDVINALRRQMQQKGARGQVKKAASNAALLGGALVPVTAAVGAAETLRRKKEGKNPYGLAGRMMGKKASAKRDALMALGGIAAGGGAGYLGGRHVGKKEDAKTPYGAPHMQFAYRKGQQDIIRRLQSQMQAQKGAQNVKKAHVNLRTPSNIIW